MVLKKMRSKKWKGEKREKRREEGKRREFLDS
jgi:hypothetical protein